MWLRPACVFSITCFTKSEDLTLYLVMVYPQWVLLQQRVLGDVHLCHQWKWCCRGSFPSFDNFSTVMSLVSWWDAKVFQKISIPFPSLVLLAAPSCVLLFTRRSEILHRCTAVWVPRLDSSVKGAAAYMALFRWFIFLGNEGDQNLGWNVPKLSSFSTESASCLSCSRSRFTLQACPYIVEVWIHCF